MTIVIGMQRGHDRICLLKKGVPAGRFRFAINFEMFFVCHAILYGATCL